MASTATTRLRLNKQGTGDNLNVWGATLNSQGLDLLDEAFGLETIALAGADVTLTSTNYASDQARNGGFRFTTTGGCSVIIPSVERFPIGVVNASNGTVAVKTSGGAAASVPSGASAVIGCDGTDCYVFASNPTDADLGQLFSTTSATSATIGNGSSITFTTTTANHGLNVGMRVVVAVTASPTTNYMAATVTSRSGTSLGVLTDSSGATGSGTYSAWTITFSQAVASLPSQTGQAGALLGTDGSTTAWTAKASEAQAQAGSANTVWMTPLRTADAITAQTLKQGIREFYVPASSMIPRITNGAAPGVSESSSNKVMTRTLDFDTTTQEFAQFSFPFPKSWDEGTVTFIPSWTAAAGTAADTVVWALQGVALSNDDAIDTAFGTEQTSSDALIATGDIHVGPESSAITIAGTPTAGDVVFFQVKRVPASDNMPNDAKLIGVTVRYTINAANDA